MRRILPASLVLLLLAVFLPLLFVGRPELLPESPYEAAAKLVPKPWSEEPLPEEDVQMEGQDGQLILRVLVGDEVEHMCMESFLFGVVAAEMPARFHPEALRAQAVAARTYTLHRMLISPSPRHPQADVCGSYACCKAFLSPAQLWGRWGAQFGHYSQIIREAVADTDGVIVVYENRPILAAFHAASYGFTEASGAIWNSVPYLQSVETFESIADVPNYYAEVALSFGEFRQIALGGIPGVVLDEGNIPHWIIDVRYTDSGRLGSLSIGGVMVTGAQFRSLFGLRSTAIRFSFDEGGMILTTGGHGHGVGMSQFGANTMAHRGYGYREILSWYYTNTGFARMDAVVCFQSLH